MLSLFHVGTIMCNILIYYWPSFGFRDGTLNMAKMSKFAESLLLNLISYSGGLWDYNDDHDDDDEEGATCKCHEQLLHPPPQKKKTLMTPYVKKRWVSSVERCHKSPSRIGMPLNCWSADMEYAMRPGPLRKGTRVNFSWTSTLFQWVTWPTSQELHRLPMLDNWVLNASISIMWFVYQWS